MTGIISVLPPLIEQPPGNNSSDPAGLPGVSYTVALLNLPQTWAALQTFPAGMISIHSSDIIGINIAQVTSQWIDSIVAGVPHLSQPAFTDVSGQATLVQLPTIGANTALGSIAGGTPIALSKTQATTLINAFTTTLSGAVPAPGSVTGKVLSDNATWVAQGSGVTSVTVDGLTITGSGTAPPRFGYANATIAVSAAASALTIALKDNAGSNPSATSPSTFWFRDVTGTGGAWTALSATGAMSLVLSSGSTLGVTSSTAFRLWVVMFNDAGTLRLSAINCAASTSTDIDIYPLNSSVPASSIAEGGAGAADSAGVFYTGTAVTLKSFVILGYVEWNSSGLTAGTWTISNLNFIQSFGPGVRLPGEVVRVAAFNNATSFSTTSSTYQTTNLAKAITPTSAANFIRFQYSGILYNRSVSSAVSAFSAMHRGSTLVGMIAEIWGQTNQAETVVGGMYYDNPNTTSSTTYAVKIKNNDATTNMSLPATGSEVCTLTLEEIMT